LHLHFFVSTYCSTISFDFVRKNVLETELGEALNDKKLYLKSDRGTQLVNSEFLSAMTAFTPLTAFLIKSYTTNRIYLHGARSGFEPESPVHIRN
jgi:hypothetical protein